MISPELVRNIPDLAYFFVFGLTIAHCFPVMQLDPKTNHWSPFGGEVVGMVGDGVGITEHKQLLDLGDGRLVNEATGDVFFQTNKDKQSGEQKKYYNQEKHILVNVYCREEI